MGGYLVTGAVGGIGARVYEARILAATPLGRSGEPQHVAPLAAWVRSRAAELVTGQVIGVAGEIMLADV